MRDISTLGHAEIAEHIPEFLDSISAYKRYRK